MRQKSLEADLEHLALAVAAAVAAPGKECWRGAAQLHTLLDYKGDLAWMKDELGIPSAARICDMSA